MQDITKRSRLEVIGEIKDIVSKTTSYRDPFLYYLPELLIKPEFENVDVHKVLNFVNLALNYEKSAIIFDALAVLNKLVRHEDGSLVEPGPDVFFTNQSFLWKELGDHKTAVDIIMHVLNKTMFTSALGN